MSKDGAIRILIVDDHPVVREGLAALVERRPDMTVVGEAGTGAAAVVQFRRLLPDVTLMDLRMPELGGVAAIGQIRAEFPAARIIVLTTYDGDDDIYHGLQAGARAYLLKDAPRDELLDAIRAVHAGQTRIPPAVAARLAERMMSGPDLSPRELAVLTAIVAGRSNREIGTDLTISEGTVKAHINSILGKLGVTDRTQAVTTALQRGIVHLE